MAQDDALLHQQSTQPFPLHQNTPTNQSGFNATNGTANTVNDDLNNSPGDDSLEDLRELNDPSDENGDCTDEAMKVGGLTPNITPERDIEEGEPMKLVEHNNESRICRCWCQVYILMILNPYFC